MTQGRAGLVRATLTLLAGGALAQALPLLLGPWLTRLYLPEEFGHYTVFAAVAANLAVVACGRYDFALPLARDEAEARDLMALCLRVLVTVTASTALLAGVIVSSERQPTGAGCPWRCSCRRRAVAHVVGDPGRALRRPVGGAASPSTAAGRSRRWLAA